MSTPASKPTWLTGGILHSGDVNTGQFRSTKGGGQAATLFSGALLLGSGSMVPVTNDGTGHVKLWSGAGRLDNVQALHAISGVEAIFYDSHVPAASGVATYASEGKRVLCRVPANTIGLTPFLGGGPLPVDVGMPFHSGLCLSLPSGAPGVTFSWTPEVNQ